jgi:hypothetical protein
MHLPEFDKILEIRACYIHINFDLKQTILFPHYKHMAITFSYDAGHGYIILQA